MEKLTNKELEGIIKDAEVLNARCEKFWSRLIAECDTTRDGKALYGAGNVLMALQSALSKLTESENGSKDKRIEVKFGMMSEMARDFGVDVSDVSRALNCKDKRCHLRGIVLRSIAIARGGVVISNIN
jgi:hypothetical protein